MVHATDCVLEEDDGFLTRVGFRYRDGYLNSANPIAIDPVQLPLAAGEVTQQCQGDGPAFIDDYLPDSWGRRVLARLALYRDHRDFNANTQSSSSSPDTRSNSLVLLLTNTQGIEIA